MRWTGAAALTAALTMAGAAQAGQKTMMHCFAFTPIKSAAQAQWDAFYKATDEMPKKIKVVKKVWYGKLRAPLGQFRTDAETSKKLVAGSERETGTVTRVVREYGVCMEMTNEAALKVYAEHPYHKEWVAVYEKVRVAGTTTYDIIGQ